MRNKDIYAMMVQPLSKRKCMKIAYDVLVMYDVDLKIHQFDNKNLSMYDKLKEGRKDQKKKKDGGHFKRYGC